jgi:hypothetical protein
VGTSFGGIVDEMIAQYVEADLVDGGVGDIASVGSAAFGCCGALRDRTDGQTEQGIERSHPLGVTTSKKVVDRDDVHRTTGQHIADGSQCPGKGLALTGGHLDDITLTHPDGGEKLNIERLHVERTRRSLADEREVAGYVEGVGAFDPQVGGCGGHVGVGQCAGPVGVTAGSIDAGA